MIRLYVKEMNMNRKKLLTVCISVWCITITLSAAPMMDSRVRKVPVDITERIFIDPEETLPKLVSCLTAGMKETRPKVKVLHDWICDNIAYDTDIFNDYTLVPRQSYIEVLKKRAAICAGYANLFAAMCYYAKIECITISGWSKGFGYRGYLKDESDHAWNAVKINGKWSLIDVTWDAGFVDYSNYVKSYSTQWFMKSGGQFIYSHLPKEDDKQFISKIKTKEEFIDEPYIEPVFFEHGLALGERMPHYNNEVTDDTSFELKLSDTAVRLDSTLRRKDGSGAVHDAVWNERNGNKFTIYCDVPDRGRCEVNVYVYNPSFKSIPHVLPDDSFRRIAAEVRDLAKTQKIAEEDAKVLLDSYYQSPDLECSNWYYKEDLFDKARINTVKKVLAMTDYGLENSERVLSFDIEAAEGYAGYGEGWRFPKVYIEFSNIKNLHLIESPTGSVKKGSTVKVAVESREFSGFAWGVDHDYITKFAKTDVKNVYEAEIVVPEDGKVLNIYGTRDGKKYFSYWYYQIE